MGTTPLFRATEYIAATVKIQMGDEGKEESILAKSLKWVGKAGVGLGLLGFSSLAISAAMDWVQKPVDEDEGEEWVKEAGEEPLETEAPVKTETTPIPSKVSTAKPEAEEAAPAKAEPSATKMGMKETRDWVKATPAPVVQPASPSKLASVRVSARSASVDAYIDEASNISGVDKAVLLAVANQESAFKENAAAGTSSAKGLFQITSGTWRALVAKYGDQYGIKLSDINNPRANAIMGAIYIRTIMEGLTKFLGRQPTITDIYAGHFLGPSGVKTLLNTLDTDPSTDAVKLLPKAARANPGIFKNKDGSNRTVAQVYDSLYSKVGLQYEKFAMEEGLSNKYAGSVASGLTSVAQAPATDSTVPKVASVSSSVVPVKFNVASANGSNTRPVPVKFDVPERAVGTEATTDKEETEKQTNVIAMNQDSKNSHKSDPRYIRRSGRLLTIG